MTLLPVALSSSAYWEDRKVYMARLALGPRGSARERRKDRPMERLRLRISPRAGSWGLRI